MLINLSNHPSENWDGSQKSEAIKQFGKIYDLPFPSVDPEGDEFYILQLAESYFKKIIKIFNKTNDPNNAVHIMGELTFSFQLVGLLKHNNIICIASTTERQVLNKGNVKSSEFGFCRFRQY
ncbi:MAG TPA: CRISPR-associated protein [Candidatus Paceibacterota bacterium]|nr:CRISPR-associated protein [Candidatus Paceibacterota bacterium]